MLYANKPSKTRLLQHCNGQVHKISHPTENRGKHGHPNKRSNSGPATNSKKKPKLLSHRWPQNVMIMKKCRGKTLRIRSIPLQKLRQIDRRHKEALIKTSKSKESLSNKRQQCKRTRVNYKGQGIFFYRDKQHFRVLLEQEQEVLVTATVKTEVKTKRM